MPANLQFLPRYVREIFCEQLQLHREALVERALSAFSEEELTRRADEVEAAAYERLESGGCYDEYGPDPSDLAESAFDEGLEIYLNLRDLRQGTLNLFAVALSHLVEQQELVVVRQWLLPSGHPVGGLDYRDFVNGNNHLGIGVETLPGWKKLRELREVANVAKHTEGRSFENLRSLRPDLFENPAIGGIPGLISTPRVSEPPLFGRGLYVREEDLNAYFDAALAFWDAYAGSVVGIL